jgi:CRAL/TRIO domain
MYAGVVLVLVLVFRLEQITVMNLEGLSVSLFTPKIYAVLKHVDDVASTFPEMLHTLIVLNAPGFFTFVYNAMKRFLDAKTAQLIEIYSSPSRGRERLLELIDDHQLPMDYGGRAPSTSELILREGHRRGGPVPRYQVVELVKVRRKRPAELTFALKADERVELSVYTRSKFDAELSLSANPGTKRMATKTIHPEEGRPHCFQFGEFAGPGEFKLHTTVAADSMQYFLVFGQVFERISGERLGLRHTTSGDDEVVA